MLRFFTAPLDVYRPNTTSKELREKIVSSSSLIVEHDFGQVLGSVYFVKPDDTAMLKELVKKLHQQPEVRKTDAASAWLTSGRSLLSLPTHEATPFHHIFSLGLSHSKNYTVYTIDALKNFLVTEKKMRLTTLTGEPIYNLLAKGLFGIDQLPDDLMQVFKKFATLLSGEEEGELIEDDKPVTKPLSYFVHGVHQRLCATYVPRALDFHPNYKPHRDARDAYAPAAKAFIESQAKVIKSDLLKYTNNKEIHNVLSLSVIELIKQGDSQLKDDRELLNIYIKRMVEDEDASAFNALLSDKYLLTVPSNIFAADNLKTLIPCILHALASNPDLLNSLRENLAAHGLDEKLSNMHDVIESDKKNNHIMHRLYLEGMRLRLINPRSENHKFGDRLLYYVTNPITIGDTVIQGKSVVCIMNSMRLSDPVFGPDPQKFNPDRFIDNPAAATLPLVAFSYLPRRCPADKITEYIAKTFIADLVVKYDFKLYAKEGEHQPTKIQIEFTERRIELKERKGLVA